MSLAIFWLIICLCSINIDWVTAISVKGVGWLWPVFFTLTAGMTLLMFPCKPVTVGLGNFFIQFISNTTNKPDWCWLKAIWTYLVTSSFKTCLAFFGKKESFWILDFFEIFFKLNCKFRACYFYVLCWFEAFKFDLK